MAQNLYDLLGEAELQQYYQKLRDELKVTSVPQLKYVEEEDLAGIGMTKPEQRRLKKFFKKAYPQGAFGKIKKILSKGPGDGTPPPQSPPVGRAQPQPKPGSRHIIPEESIILQKTLGGGEFGTVQQGLWTNEEGERLQVAIKCLSKEHMHSGMADFLKEATIMHSIDHDHIVRLYGVVLGSENLMLVTELAPLRSLLECLKEPALRASFPVMQLCDFAIQIADGMTYLENKRLIHRDLAARNILVFARDQIKVSDFGLSRALGVGSDYYQTNFNVNLKLPIAWCAPECINYLKFTSASDVWAYGVTLWEMFSYGFQPWAAFTGQQILEAIDEPTCQRLEQPEFCPCDYYEIMLKCWDQDPDARPTFSHVLHMLPQAKPEQVQAVRECPPDGTQEALSFKTGEVITVLDNNPEGAPVDGMWKGVLENGRTGFFYPGDTTPYIEIKTISPATRPKKVTRRESARKSQKPILRQKIKADMISKPQNDLRHTGHIGYDGAVFGDVSFIGDNYDKLPVKVVAPYQPQNDLQGSSGSLPRDTEVEKGFDVFSKSPGGITSSQLSLRSDFSSVGDTLTDVSSMPADTSGSASSKGVSGFDDFEIPSSGLDDFKMPDLSSDLDFGSSLMDDIMKAFDSKKDDSETETADKETDHAPSDVTKDNWELDVETPEQQKPSESFISSSDLDGQFSTSLASPEVLTPLSSSDNSSFCASGYTAHTTAMTYTAEPASPSPPPVSRKPERFVRRQDVDDDNIINGISALSVTGQSPESTGRQDFNFEQSTERESTEASGLSSREMSPEKESEGRKKSRLKLPLHGSTHRTKKEAKVKPMSSSDEKTLEEAIALVEEFTQYNTKESMLHSPISVTHGREMSPESEGSSPKIFRGLSFGKSPKQDHKSFSDELSSVSDLSEDLTPESQDAYNELVMRGSFKEKEKGPAGVRERRMRRSVEHQKNYVESEGMGKNGRPVNMNIREPQGIPVRRPSTQTEEEAEVDVNPLRRLRDSKAAVTPRARAPRIPLDTGSKFGGASRFSAQRFCSSNLNGTDEAEPSVGGGLSPKQTHSQQVLVDESCNPLPLPPKHFPKPLIMERPLRERRYPLNVKCNVNPRLASENSPGDSHQSPAPSPSSSLVSSCENVFDFSPQEELKSPPYIAPKPQNEKPQYTLTPASDNDHAHRLNNNIDLFWTQKMKSYELIDEEAVDSGACDGLVLDPDQLNISDSISYEEQLELALDGPQERNEEFSEEVHQMKSALTLEVEDECRQTLHQEDMKPVKLRQLVSQGLGDVNSCKQALVCSGWDLTAATSYLIAHPPDQASPECIDV